MRNVNFVFPKSDNEDCKVLCTNPFCAKSTLESFLVTDQISKGLWNDRVNTVDMPMETSEFMSNRRRMQGGDEMTDQILGRRYQSAVSS